MSMYLFVYLYQKISLITKQIEPQYTGNRNGKKNVPQVWSTPSFKALNMLNLFDPR